MRSVVVVADLQDQAVNEVRQILFDWYLSGLVQPIVWLDIRPGDRTITAVVNGEPTRLSLSIWLDKYLDAKNAIELFSLQVANQEGNYFNDRDIEAALRDFPMLVAAETQMVNVVAPPHRQAAIPDDVLLPYRTNIALLPIQGASGYAGYKVLNEATSEFFANVASGLASATGTWAGQVDNPLMNLPVAKQRKPEIILLRSFARYADASSLVTGLVDQIKGPNAGLPGAFDDFGERLTPVSPDASLSKVEIVANNFIAENATRFNLSAFKDRPVFNPKPLSWRKLLAEYFAYLRKYFQVGSWIKEKIDGYKAAAAQSLQQIFLGHNSAREVFVLGVSADSPRNDDSTLDAIEALLNATNSVTQSVMEPQQANPNDLWKDYVHLMSGLADGKSRVGEIELPGVLGGDRRLILNPNHLAPKPGSPSFRIPEFLPIRLKGEVVRATDPYLSLLLEDQLESVLSHPERHSSVDVASAQRTKQELRIWKSQIDSFAWRIGLKLANSLNEARAMLGKINFSKELEDDEQRKLFELEANVRKAIGRLLKGLLGIVLGSLAAWVGQALWLFFALGAWPVALATNWIWPVVIVSALLASWTALGFQQFAGAVRDIYKHENRAEHDRDVVKWVNGIRPQLRQEVSRLADLYRQLEMWNQLIVPVLHNPLGETERETQERTSIKNLNQLTTSIQLAEFSPSAPERKRLVADVESEFFARGWLSTLLVRHLEALGATFPKTWSDTAQEDKSNLRKMLRQSSSDLRDRMLGDSTLKRVQEIALKKANYSEWPVKILNLDRELSAKEYLEGLSHGIGALPSEMLSDSAAVKGFNRVDLENSYFLHDPRLDSTSDLTEIETQTQAVETVHKLDLISVRVEISKPMRFSEFTAFFQIAPDTSDDSGLLESPVA